MTEAEKMAEEMLLKIEGVDWVDWEYDGKQLGIIRDAIRRVAEREMEEACFAIHSIPREQRNKRAICQRAIRARRWWEEEA